MRCCSVARHLEAWPSASDLPRPSRTRKPCPRPTPPGRPSASHLPRLRRTRKSCPGAQVRATSRACAVRESLVRASHLLIGHAQAASVAVGRGARLSFLLRILFEAGRQGALAAPKRIRSKKDRRVAPSPPQKEFEAKKTEARRMHTAPANSAMFIFQVSFFCFELSLGRGAAPRCNICAWSLSLSFSTAHAAAIPLTFDALPRRVTLKLAGYIM